MKFFTKIALIFIGISSIFILSCRKQKDISPIPRIEFKSFVPYANDSAVLVIKFEDGDGDIGLTQADTSGSFAKSSEYYNNLYLIYYYKKDDGNFSRFAYLKTIKKTPPTPDSSYWDTLKLAYRIPDLRPKGQNKVLEGEIKAKIPAPYYWSGDASGIFPPHKTFRYEVYIYDRELHKSNLVTTQDVDVVW